MINESSLAVRHQSGRFSEGRAVVNVGGRYGVIDRQGNFIINPRFDGAAPLCDGIAAVRIDDAWGAIDRNGWLFRPSRGAPFCFDGPLALTLLEPRGSQWGYIDRDGKHVRIE